ncbi:MAG TPA: hypothetical protein VKZ54_05790, partial [Membranihabitans sp.]|nr:hypothetical protein [Membranihabitans sp.]
MVKWKYSVLKVIGVLILIPGLGIAQNRFSIEILDREAEQVLSPDAKIEIIGTGFMWTEGPLYVEDGDYLLVSDIPQNKVFKIDSTGRTLEYLHPSGFLGSHFTGEEPG